MTKFENIIITEHKINKTKELDKILALMEKIGVENPISLLPSGSWHEVSFDIKESHAGFAHGLYRVLIDELSVICAVVEEENITSDDKFVMDSMYQLLKNINLIPVRQSLTDDELKNYTIQLNKYNNTDDVIDIKASDFVVLNKSESKKKKGSSELKKKKGSSEYNELKSDIDIKEIFPEPNTLIIRLRPGHYINIKNLSFERGYQKDDAAKFSLLNNIKYRPVDIIPYNIFAKHGEEKGTRSIEYDCKEFHIEFSTCGNIEPLAVIELLTDKLIKDLTNIKNKVVKYAESKEMKKVYNDEGIEIAVENGMYRYKFYDHYLTMMNMISQRCYMLDPSISYCIGAVERFDNEVGLLKLIHGDPNKLIINAIDSCMRDLNNLLNSFKKKD